MSVIKITADNFEQEVLNNPKPVLIDFYADWCGPCKRVAPIMESIAQEYEGEVIVYKVNVDKEQKLPLIFKVKNIGLFSWRIYGRNYRVFRRRRTSRKI